ncbi:MAG: acyltransferase [Gammaproteobacteria bacterium 39-13]|nr:carbon-nitrogen hydrolase [Gammaproteobacteria bacterium]OJV91810.1 MAG: acyltransferase [Gammaproteobacteria bacterium 39-13]
MTEKTLTIALIQETGYKTAEQSYQALESRIREAVKQGAKLILLQELHSHYYFPQQENTDHFDLGESIPGPTTQFFSLLAKELKIVIVTSIFEKRASGLYHNTAVVLEQNGEIAGCYRKMHIPDDPGFYEKFYFTPGDLGFRPIQTSVGKLGVLVCWDQWFPEAARLMALNGADLLLYPTAIGWSPEDDQAEKQRQLDAWTTVQRGHAIANGLPVVVCNRVGTEEALQFWGNSFVAGPQGEILAKAGESSPQSMLCEIQFSRTETVRRIWPFLRDRRIDAYEHLTQRYLG